MREILFRGKRVDNGEWVYGVPIKKALVGSHDGYYPKIIPECDGRHQTVYSTAIEEETVGQYTGLTDKNGAKIFEGDILKGNEYPYYSDGKYNYYAEVVFFDDGCFAVGLCTHKNPESTVKGISDGICEWIEDFNSDNWLIIGNIYDNPELLEC